MIPNNLLFRQRLLPVVCVGLLMASFSSLPAAAQAGDVQRQRGKSTAVTVHRDLVYATIGERPLRIDLYLPADDAAERPLPVVMWIHGGAWRSGKKGNAGPARALVDRGYAVADVEYRLSGEALFPAQIQDCKAAIRWLRASAKTYGLDADHIGAWGSSAGGHLAALLGTSAGVDAFETAENSEHSSRIQAVCDWFGPTDLLQMNAQAIEGSRLDHDAANSPESQLVGGPIQQPPFRKLAEQANPIRYVSKDDPPFLLVHGDQDRLVSYRQSVILFEALKKAGVDARLNIVQGAAHGFRGSRNAALIEEAADFFDQHLRPHASK